MHQPVFSDHDSYARVALGAAPAKRRRVAGDAPPAPPPTCPPPSVGAEVLVCDPVLEQVCRAGLLRLGDLRVLMEVLPGCQVNSACWRGVG